MSNHHDVKWEAEGKKKKEAILQISETYVLE